MTEPDTLERAHVEPDLDPAGTASPVLSEDAHAALRADIRRLGNILGDTIAEHEGPDVLQAVEHLRALARDPNAAGELSDVLGAAPPDRAGLLARAGAMVLQLGHLAAQGHRE